MGKGKEEKSVPLLPEEVARYCGGGEKYGSQALAQRVVEGDIPPENVRRIVGVGKDGNPIYAQESGTSNSILPPCSFIGPNGEKHRQPLRVRR